MLFYLNLLTSPVNGWVSEQMTESIVPKMRNFGTLELSLILAKVLWFITNLSTLVINESRFGWNNSLVAVTRHNTYHWQETIMFDLYSLYSQWQIPLFYVYLCLENSFWSQLLGHTEYWWKRRGRIRTSFCWKAARQVLRMVSRWRR